MKKLLLGVLTTITFLGLVGCDGGGKKLSAEEAKTEIRAIAENTDKNKGKLSSLKAKTSFKGSVSAKNMKAKAGSQTVDLGSIKASAKFEGSFDASINPADKKAKIGAKVNASASADIKSAYLVSMMGEKGNSKKYNLSAKGSFDGYYVGNEEDLGFFKYNSSNTYIDYSASINKELADLLKSTETSFKGAKNLYSYDSIFEMFEEDEDDDEVLFDYDMIKDWTIFTKKGNTLTADCSNLAAFDLENYEDTQEMLKQYGLELKVSKLQFTLTNDKVITGFDFAMSIKGSTDLSKLNDSSSMLAPSYSGTLTFDLSFDFGFDLEYGTQPNIEVPENLTKLEAEEIDELFDLEDIIDAISDIMGSGSGSNSGSNTSAKKADNLVSCMKMVAMEAAAQSSGNVTVTVDFGDTEKSLPTLKVYDGATDKTSDWNFYDEDAYVEGLKATGSASLTYDVSTSKFTYSVTNLKVNGSYISITSDGHCELAK